MDFGRFGLAPGSNELSVQHTTVSTSRSQDSSGSALSEDISLESTNALVDEWCRCIQSSPENEACFALFRQEEAMRYGTSYVALSSSEELQAQQQVLVNNIPTSLVSSGSGIELAGPNVMSDWGTFACESAAMRTRMPTPGPSLSVLGSSPASNAMFPQHMYDYLNGPAVSIQPQVIAPSAFVPEGISSHSRAADKRREHVLNEPFMGKIRNDELLAIPTVDLTGRRARPRAIASSSRVTLLAPTPRRAPLSLNPAPRMMPLWQSPIPPLSASSFYTQASTPPVSTPADIPPLSAGACTHLTTHDVPPTITCPLVDCGVGFANTDRGTVDHVYGTCLSRALAHTRPTARGAAGAKAACRVVCPERSAHARPRSHFKTLRTWVQHLITMHGGRPRATFCLQCPAAFRSDEELVLHDRQRARCTYCGTQTSCGTKEIHEEGCRRRPGLGRQIPQTTVSAVGTPGQSSGAWDLQWRNDERFQPR